MIKYGGGAFWAVTAFMAIFLLIGSQKLTAHTSSDTPPIVVSPLQRNITKYLATATTPNNATYYAEQIIKYSTQDSIPPYILASVLMVESHANEKALGKAGEIGLMQIQPRYWTGVFPDCGQNLWFPETNICYGAKVLKYFRSVHNGRLKDAIYYYNNNGDPQYTIKVYQGIATIYTEFSSWTNGQ